MFLNNSRIYFISILFVGYILSFFILEQRLTSYEDNTILMENNYQFDFKGFGVTTEVNRNEINIEPTNYMEWDVLEDISLNSNIDLSLNLINVLSFKEHPYQSKFAGIAFFVPPEYL